MFFCGERERIIGWVGLAKEPPPCASLAAEFSQRENFHQLDWRYWVGFIRVNPT
jgi:hypothetical protein